MKNTLFYALTVIIWGSTWLAIEYQLGDVAVEVSLFYRFLAAAVLVFIISWVGGLSLKFSLKQHGYIALLGLLNFCINYVTLYEAQKYLTSAMTSIGFSTLLLINIINSKIFFGRNIVVKTYIGALFGIVGIITLFWPEIVSFKNGENSGSIDTVKGMVLVLLGTIFASLGNMVSIRNSNHSYPILQSSGWGMFYGSVFLLIFALINGAEFKFSYKPEYMISLGYLTVFGTVIAFYSYFFLLKNIGPEKASYSIVMFPVVAVILSSFFEDFVWDIYSISGFILVGVGNLIMLVPENKFVKLKVFVINQTFFYLRLIRDGSKKVKS